MVVIFILIDNESPDPPCANKHAGPEVIKLFFMLNSTEHKILTAHKN